MLLQSGSHTHKAVTPVARLGPGSLKRAAGATLCSPLRTACLPYIHSQWCWLVAGIVGSLLCWRDGELSCSLLGEPSPFLWIEA